VMKLEEGADHDCFFLSWEDLQSPKNGKTKMGKKEKTKKKKMKKRREGGGNAASSASSSSSSKRDESGGPAKKKKGSKKRKVVLVEPIKKEEDRQQKQQDKSENEEEQEIEDTHSSNDNNRFKQQQDKSEGKSKSKGKNKRKGKDKNSSEDSSNRSSSASSLTSSDDSSQKISDDSGEYPPPPSPNIPSRACSKSDDEFVAPVRVRQRPSHGMSIDDLANRKAEMHRNDDSVVGGGGGGGGCPFHLGAGPAVPNLARRRNSYVAPSPSSTLLKQLQSIPTMYSSTETTSGIPGNTYVVRSKSGGFLRMQSLTPSPSASPYSSASSSLNTSPRSFSPRRPSYSQIYLVKSNDTTDPPPPTATTDLLNTTSTTSTTSNNNNNNNVSPFVLVRGRRRFGQSYELPHGAFDELFPFHIVLNHDMNILRYGPVIQRLCGLSEDMQPMEKFYENWKFVRPDISPLDVTQLARYENVFHDCFIIQHIPSGLEMKYQLLFGQQSNFHTTQTYAYMVGTPVLKDAKEAQSYGLSFKDFALHDATKELLLKSGLDNSLMVAALSFQKRSLTLEEAVKELEMEQGRTKQLLKFQQEQNKELEKARDLANKAAQLKTHFLSNMSHEIRTPMNAIIGMTELLLQTELEEQQRESAQLVYTAGEILLSIINDILDFSKIEAGKLELDMKLFDLHECVNGVCDILDLKAFEKGLQLYSLLQIDAPRYVFGDCRRLQQIIINLLNNAIKFTSEGEVFVKYVIEEEDMPSPYSQIDRPSVRLKFDVTDSGIGIAEEDFPALFQAFTQLDTKNRCGGTGLGLAIAKQLTELMHGEITLSSQLGVGSTFSFTAVFPVASDVDLNPTILEGQDKDKERTEVTNVDGRHPFKKLTRRASSALSVNSVVTTSESALTSKDKENSSSAPVPPTPSSTPATPTVPPATSEKELRKRSTTGKQILVAEDNPTNQKVISKMLERLGYSYDMVSDGVEALSAVGLGQYTLLLLDIHMPNMGGLEASTAIRRLDRGLLPKQPTILALSAEVLEGVEQSCKNAGMDGYIAKPVRMEELKRVLSRYL